MSNRKVKSTLIKGGIVDKNEMMYSKRILKKRVKNLENKPVLEKFNVRKRLGYIESAKYKDGIIIVSMDIDSNKIMNKVLRSSMRPAIRKIKSHQKIIGGKMVDVIDDFEFISVGIISKETDIYEKE